MTADERRDLMSLVRIATPAYRRGGLLGAEEVLSELVYTEKALGLRCDRLFGDAYYWRAFKRMLKANAEA